MPFDPNKPATLGPLSSAEIRENFRALKEDRIVDAGWLSSFPLTAFVLKSTPTVITAVHTFNPTTAGAPFALGSNAQGQLVTGLNADTVDGQHANAFASATHNHDTSYIRKGTADTITAVHTFSPSTASAPFILGENAQGQLVTGLNADTVDGQHANAFAPASHNHDASYVRKGTADTITAVHTFNPSTAGAPFILGSNAQGRLVTGLNADTVDGQHAEAFSPANHNHDTRYIRKDIAETISVIHTFNPTSANAPFTLGANAQGQLVTGLNADTVDGQHASAFASSSHNHDTTYVRKGTADTITAVHTFNPSSASAPFAIGANAQGQLVTGLNADTVDGQHGDAFVRKSSADTITAVHTFNPSSAGAPFILGSNAQGRLVSGLNADMVDGYHMTDFRRAMTSDITVTVGSGGDFRTINDAINYLVNNFLPPCYRTNSGMPKAKIRILSGTTIAENIFVDGLDLSWIIIESVDNAVTVNTTALSGTFIVGYNGARLPKINVFFNMTGYFNVQVASGLYLDNASWAFVLPGKGIRETSSSRPVVCISNGSMLIGSATIWRGNTTDFVISGHASMLVGSNISIVNTNTYYSSRKVSRDIFVIGHFS